MNQQQQLPPVHLAVEKGDRDEYGSGPVSDRQQSQHSQSTTKVQRSKKNPPNHSHDKTNESVFLRIMH